MQLAQTYRKAAQYITGNIPEHLEQPLLPVWTVLKGI